MADTTGTSAPWTGTTVTNPGDAGAYGANLWSTIWSQITGFDADEANVGVLRAIEDELEVQATAPASQQIAVQTGAALIKGKWYYNDSITSFTIAANGLGGNRLDLVVLQIDYVQQEVRLIVLQGTVVNVEPVPTQVAGTLWEVPIALVTVPSPLVTITQANIEDRRDYANMPAATALLIENNSAIVYEKGTVVVNNSPLAGYPLDTTSTATAGDEEVVGVVVTPIAIGSAGRIITYGIAPVLCDELVAVGDYLETSTTAGEAQTYASGQANCMFARVLVANTGANTKALCLVDMAQFRSLSWIEKTAANFQYNTSLAALTWVSGNYGGFYVRTNNIYIYATDAVPATFQSLVRATLYYVVKAHNADFSAVLDMSHAVDGTDKDTTSTTVTGAAIVAGEVDFVKSLDISTGLAALAANSGISYRLSGNVADISNHLFPLAVVLEYVASEQ